MRAFDWVNYSFIFVLYVAWISWWSLLGSYEVHFIDFLLLERYWVSVESQNEAQPLHICVILPPSAFGCAVKRSGRDEPLLGRSFQASLPKPFFLYFFFSPVLHFSFLFIASLLLLCTVFLVSNHRFCVCWFFKSVFILGACVWVCVCFCSLCIEWVCVRTRLSVKKLSWIH